jgi:ubiquitin-like 1-activating enzyme E1 B
VLQSLKEDDHLVWDKDDKNAMDFVASCANIRAHIFSIPQKTRFDIKCKYNIPYIVKMEKF